MLPLVLSLSSTQSMPRRAGSCKAASTQVCAASLDELSTDDLARLVENIVCDVPSEDAATMEAGETDNGDDDLPGEEAKQLLSAKPP